MKKTAAFFVTTAGVALVSAPAFAGTVQPVPEPSALSLIAGTAVAVIIASRFMRRKQENQYEQN